MAASQRTAIDLLRTASRQCFTFSECIVIFGAVPIHRLNYAIGGCALVGLFVFVFVTVANLKI
jgi:hypothetical protein